MSKKSMFIGIVFFVLMLPAVGSATSFHYSYNTAFSQPDVDLVIEFDFDDYLRGPGNYDPISYFPADTAITNLKFVVNSVDISNYLSPLFMWQDYDVGATIPRDMQLSLTVDADRLNSETPLQSGWPDMDLWYHTIDYLLYNDAGDLIAQPGWSWPASIWTITTNDVPEPATLLLFVIGLAGVGFTRCQRKLSA